jgi:hypothetical protein
MPLPGRRALMPLRGRPLMPLSGPPHHAAMRRWPGLPMRGHRSWTGSQGPVAVHVGLDTGLLRQLAGSKEADRA